MAKTTWTAAERKALSRKMKAKWAAKRKRAYNAAYRKARKAIVLNEATPSPKTHTLTYFTCEGEEVVRNIVRLSSLSHALLNDIPLDRFAVVKGTAD